jgi:hypothetical protein
LAWLLSFPNSGTTFTLKYIQGSTNTTTATNYGGGEQVGYNTSISVFANQTLGGPYFRYPERPVPSTFLLTKTHCGGFCNTCNPHNYVIANATLFHTACKSGDRRVNYTTTVPVVYDDSPIPPRIHRAVHVIRNPFDNIVARLRYERKKWSSAAVGTERYEYFQQFTDDPDGFSRWCQFLDDTERRHYTRYMNRHGNTFHPLYSTNVWSILTNLSCAGEFFRYLQWHVRAYEMTQYLDIPTYYLYYENYTSNFEQTTFELLTFLNLTSYVDAGTPLAFEPGKSYPHYFSDETRQRAQELAQFITTAETWRLLEHYFVEQ